MVVEAGGFSKAAERLNIAKSVVSRRVSALEGELGVQLLQRTTRTQSLTGPGRQFYQRAVHILADLEEAEQSIVDASAALRGRLRLAAPLSFGLHRLNAAISGFMREHPGIELELDLNDREINLVEEGFDMAVRIGEPARLHPARAPARQHAPGDLRQPRLPGSARHPRTPGRVGATHRPALCQCALKQAWQFAAGGREPLVAIPQIRIRANNGDALAAAAVAGLGIVNTPAFIVDELIASGELVPILNEYRRPPLGIYAVYPPGRLMPRRVQALADFLASQFGDQG